MGWGLGGGGKEVVDGWVIGIPWLGNRKDNTTPQLLGSSIFNMFERIISPAIDNRENYLRKDCACDWRSSRNFDADCALCMSSLDYYA